MPMTEEQARQALLDMPDEVLQNLRFSFPWQSNVVEETNDTVDGDFKTPVNIGNLQKIDIKDLQNQCWSKYHTNPQINTAIRGMVGRVCGLGFESTSGVPEIQKIISETELDWRNRLYNFWPKYFGRSILEGELYLVLTLHVDGFVEVDFLDPVDLDTKGDGGIIWHPTKTCLPLFYCIKFKNEQGIYESFQIPSIFVAKYPELVNIAAKNKDFDVKLQKDSKKSKYFKETGGYFRFVVGFDKGLVTRRAISYLLTTLQWLNYYENLKKYEIDHKKSSGAYLWEIQVEDTKAFKLWLSLTDEERKLTGIMQKKVPGGTLIMPPGMSLKCHNPSLTSIKEQDTDILHMITSGLNEPEDVSTGQSKGTFASVKASRGPMSDRTSDEVAYFDRFLKHDFWASVFLLRASVGKMKPLYKVRECVGFASKKPKFEEVEHTPQELVEISYPISETVDFEARARALLGVKHGPVAETLGMPGKEIARRMGIGSYASMRQRKATEDDMYPELEYNVDAETLQENVQSGNAGKKSATKGKSNAKE